MARRWRRLSRTTKAARTGARGPALRIGRRHAAQFAQHGHAPVRHRPLRCAPARAPRRASRASEVGTGPHRTRRGVHRGRQRAAHFHREVQPRRVGPAVVQVVAVVDEVDAADEGHLLVAHAQLLVQAAQLAGLQPGIPAVERAEDLQPHAAAGQPARARAAAWRWSRSRPPPRAPPRRAPRRGSAHRRWRWPAGSSWKM